jgi:hypothetical protein
MNVNFFRWARPHKGLRRGVLFVRRSRKPAENTAQWKKGHLWMETSSLGDCHNNQGVELKRIAHLL